MKKLTLTTPPIPAVVISKPDYDIVLPDQNYKGLTYGNLIADWWKWIFSEYPDSRQDDVVMFLRGVIGAPPRTSKEDLINGTLDIFNDPAYVNDRRGFNGITIKDSTAIFFPIADSNFVIGDRYKGQELQSTYECRVAARDELKTFEKAFVFIAKTDEKGNVVKDHIESVVDNINLFYAESPEFTINVSPRNNIQQEAAYELTLGNIYEGVAVGYYLLMTNFKEGTYRIWFGTASRLDYKTSGLYDIKVIKDNNIFNVEDVSSEMKSSPMFLK